MTMLMNSPLIIPLIISKNHSVSSFGSISNNKEQQLSSNDTRKPTSMSKNRKQDCEGSRYSMDSDVFSIDSAVSRLRANRRKLEDWNEQQRSQRISVELNDAPHSTNYPTFNARDAFENSAPPNLSTRHYSKDIDEDTPRSVPQSNSDSFISIDPNGLVQPNGRKHGRNRSQRVASEDSFSNLSADQSAAPTFPRRRPSFDSSLSEGMNDSMPRLPRRSRSRRRNSLKNRESPQGSSSPIRASSTHTKISETIHQLPSIWSREAFFEEGPNQVKDRDLMPRLPSRRCSTQPTHETEDEDVLDTIQIESDCESISSSMSDITDPTAFEGFTRDLDSLGSENLRILLSDPPVIETRQDTTDRDRKPISPQWQVSKTLQTSQPDGTQPVPSALQKLADMLKKGMPVRAHYYRFKKYDKTFIGSEAVDFMVKNNMAATREDAVFLGQRFMKELGVFFHVCWDHTFKDGYYFYRFVEATKESNTPDFKRRDSVTQVSSMDLKKIADLFQRSIIASTNYYHLRKYKKTFVGSEAVDYMVNSNIAKSRKDAVFLGQRLLDELNLFHHCCNDHQFKDAYLFYRYTEATSVSPGNADASLSSISSAQRSMSINPPSSKPALLQKSSPCSIVVSFDTFQERLYETILDVHPSTSSGPSIGLGWKYVDVPPQQLPMEEKKAKKRSRDFHLSKETRQETLLELGYTRFQLKAAARLNEQIKARRRETLNNLTARTMVEAPRRNASRLFRSKRWQ